MYSSVPTKEFDLVIGSATNVGNGRLLDDDDLLRLLGAGGTISCTHHYSLDHHVSYITNTNGAELEKKNGVEPGVCRTS